jgi:hypothetical protein
MTRAFLLGALALLGACAPSAADAPIAEQWRLVEIAATPIAFDAERIGALRFRGGLDLSANDANFGGLSGLEVLEDGRFVAVSDNGDWFEGRLVLDEAGALVGVADVRTALMRDEAGQPFANKEAGDSEGLAQLPDGRFAVSFEQTQSIRIYDLNRDGPFGAARAGPTLDGVAQMPANVGLEALASTEDGALLVGAEGGAARATPMWRVGLDARAPTAPSLLYPLELGFALTSLDRAPDGGFVALERFYAPVVGARARITRFAAPAGEATTLAPERLALIAPPLPVDNFEAIAATRAPGGGVRLYIVSDDNFSERQRTLLLAFDVVEAD